ncbi:2Fe-2S ferredoxin-type domain-containing protein [Xylariales sp. AK1849]|nr:2Fe-2S ferredoxin-type domain-containing protein [Xylariales sp. AK1849]
MAAPRSITRGFRYLGSTSISTRLTRFTHEISHSTAQRTLRRIGLHTRTFTTTPLRSHGHLTPPQAGEELHITFIDKESREHTFAVSAGDNLLDIAQAHDLEMEGACGGSCACSTCHVIVLDDAYYDRMPEPDDDENDMLDLAFGLRDTSRLGCQVVMTKELDGLKVKLPSMTRNLQASDFSGGGAKPQVNQVS